MTRWLAPPPRSRNLMATCSCVFRFIASCTNALAPLHPRMICSLYPEYILMDFHGSKFVRNEGALVP